MLDHDEPKQSQEQGETRESDLGKEMQHITLHELSQW